MCHVYIRPHKGGDTHSVSLHVTNIVFEPDIDLMAMTEAAGKPVAISVKLQKARKPNGLDTVERMKETYLQ